MLSGSFLADRAWDGRLPDDLPWLRKLRPDNLVSVWANSQPNHPAILFEGRTTSYKELDALVNRAASGLIAHGVEPGDVVAVMADNSPEVVALLYGLNRAGASVLPLNPRFKQSEIDFQVADAGAKLRIAPGALTVEEVLERGHDDRVDVDYDENLFYALRYTGGTTGKPKCVATTHRSIALMHERLARQLKYGRTDVSLIVAPVAHVAIHLAAATLAAGGTISLHRTFDATRLWELIDYEGVTHALMVPTMLTMAMNGAGEAKSLRQLLVTSASFPLSLKLRIQARLPHVALYEAYGASELGLMTLCGPEDPPEKLGSVGRAAFGCMIKVLDDDGAPCAPGEIGEIYSASATLSFGYVGSIPMKPGQFRDGYLSVGDLGYLDDDGYLYVVDRRSDLIVTGGFNVYPAEVENVLLQVEGVQEAAVVGVSDEKWGRAVVAVIKGSASESALIARCRAELADYKAPKRYIFVDEIPKSAAAKIMRQALRERLEAESQPRPGSREE